MISSIMTSFLCSNLPFRAFERSHVMSGLYYSCSSMARGGWGWGFQSCIVGEEIYYYSQWYQPCPFGPHCSGFANKNTCESHDNFLAHLY